MRAADTGRLSSVTAFCRLLSCWTHTSALRRMTTISRMSAGHISNHARRSLA